MRELEPEEALKLIDELTSAKCRNCARLTARIEDRQAMAKVVRDGIDFWKIHEPAESLDAFVADRLIAYLKPSLG